MARILRRKEDVPKRSLWQRLKDIAMMDVGVAVRGGVSAGSLERLEELLLESDFGVAATLKLVAEVEHAASRGLVRTQDEFLGALRDGIERALVAGNSDPALAAAPSPPTVVLVVGVHEELNIPVKFVGVGESVEDLIPFDAAEYARELTEAE